MTGFSDIRDAVVAKIAGLADIGNVHDRDRLGVEAGLFNDLHGWGSPVEGPRPIRTWYLRRASFRSIGFDSERALIATTWTVIGHVSHDDASNSEGLLQEKADAIAAAFRIDPFLGELLHHVPAAVESGIQLVEFGSELLGETLCDRVLLSYTTRHLAPSTTDADGLADFALLSTRWDVALPDGTAEAEDDIAMETA